MNYHQTVEDIIKSATPAQRILWNYIFLRWGEKVSISQFYSDGDGASIGELGVYDARKLYLAYNLTIYGNATASVTPIYATPYDETNTVKSAIDINSAYWDTTAALAKFIGAPYTEENLLFSRIALANAYYFKFIGFRIGI